MFRCRMIGSTRWAIVAAFALLSPRVATAATYYVRQTVGKDSNDGLSAATAWEHFSKLQEAMHGGDTAYVGPGLYREEVTVMNDGAPDKPITFIADSQGEFTGDPPGRVMVAGSDPVDENIFTPAGPPNVYKAALPQFVVGVTEMDGDQHRYLRVEITKEFHIDKMPPVEIVAQTPYSFHYDEKEKVLYLHTSDGKPPKAHEIELFHRGNGIGMVGKHYVTVIGFTFRHFGDAGVNFFQGSGNGIAINNTSWGSRQGIRIYTATSILVYRNTLFRNENCGVYLANHSENGSVVENIAYENIKGVRWGSKSINGVAVGNTLFDNLERGISVEDTKNVTVVGNTLVNNVVSQLLDITSPDVRSEGNCFANGNAQQLTADFFFVDQFKTLADYVKAKHKDLTSREGNCGAIPKKLDVHKLVADAEAYTERARKLLKAPKKASAETAETVSAGGGETSGWLRRLFGR